ncbi:VanZ family protein [Paraclostridium bifermentans]|uniref:VanZ family protein n=1 Tax=Paraclostridium bifermentans TaxID=1490 RepID=UPI00374EE681
MVTLMRFNIFLIFVCIFGYMGVKIVDCIKIDNKTQFDNNMKTCFFMSILFVIALTLFPVEIVNKNSVNYNLIPFKTILTFLSNKNIIDICANILGNIILFVPLGFFAYIIFKGNKAKTLSLCLAITISVEILQLLLPARLCDVDDVITNFAGGYIGLILAFYFVKYMNKNKLCQNK